MSTGPLGLFYLIQIMKGFAKCPVTVIAMAAKWFAAQPVQFFQSRVIRHIQKNELEFCNEQSVLIHPGLLVLLVFVTP